MIQGNYEMEPNNMDPERIMWTKCYGIPFHAWSPRFLEFLTKTVGTYMCNNDITTNQSKMDVVRFMVRTKCAMVIN